MKFLQEIMTLRRIDNKLPADDEDHFHVSDHEHDHKCPCCADNSELEDDFEDEEMGGVHSLKHAYSLGRRAFHEGEKYWDNPYPRMSKEWNAWEAGFEQQDMEFDSEHEDEETGLGMYDQQGNRSQGAPIDTDPEDDEFERFCAQFTDVDFEEEEEDILSTFRDEESEDSMEDRAGAWHNGYHAADHGAPLSSNPYPAKSILSLRWEQGWREAHEDMNREWDRHNGYEEEEDVDLGLGTDEVDSDLDLDDEQSEDDTELDLDQPEDTESEDQDSNELDAIANKATEDPDKQGLIRKVKNAHLVYKRQTEDGTYEELWVYNTNNQLKDELDIRKAILAGTDIPVNKTEAPDGSQTYEVWSSGNVEMLLVKGIQN